MRDRIWNRDFVLLILSNFLMYITYYAIISVLPIYLVSELNASKSQVGIVVAAYTIASVMIRPFSGYTLDRYSRKMVFVIALIIYSLLFTGYLVALSVTALILLRFSQGLTWGFTTIAGSTIAVDLIPSAKRGEGIGYFALSTTLGMSVGPIIGLFVCHQWGYVAIFIAGFVISIASLACANTINLPRQSIIGKHLHLSMDTLFSKESVIPSLNVLIVMSTYGGLLSFIALYGKEVGVHNTSLFFLIFSIGIAVSRLTAGKAFDRNGPRKIITICLSILIVSFPILASVQNAAGYFLSAIFIGFGIGVIFPTFQSMVNNLADSTHRGAANSTLYTALDIGMGFGMAMSGLIAQYISISAIFMISAMVCLVGLIFFRVLVVNRYEENVLVR